MILHAAWHNRLQSFLRGDDGALAAVWRGLILSLWYQRFVAGANG